MFWPRTLSIIVLIPLIILIVQWGTYLYSVLIFGVAILMLIEFCRLFELIRLTGQIVVVISSGVLFCLSAEFCWDVELALIFALFVAFVSQIFQGRVEGAFFSVTISLTGAIYIGWGFGYHLILIRHLTDVADKPVGSELIFFLIAIIWCGDIAAYLFGKRFGRHKLIPQISPGKTIEGTVVGLGFGTLGGLVIWYILLQDILKLAHVPILGLLLGGISQISDLSESVIKRNAGVKDSGSLIPGHGGLLDRCDSLIFSAPALYYYFTYFGKL
jgi:phosphatidate cytidylyltransferase